MAVKMRVFFFHYPYWALLAWMKDRSCVFICLWSIRQFDLKWFLPFQNCNGIEIDLFFRSEKDLFFGLFWLCIYILFGKYCLSSMWMGFVFEEEKFDCPSVQTTKSVVFCTTPRCGSNMLCFSLIKTGLIGVPLEYFNHVQSMHDFQKRISDSGTVYDYLNALLEVRTTPNGVFSMKIHHH